MPSTQTAPLFGSNGQRLGWAVLVSPIRWSSLGSATEELRQFVRTELSRLVFSVAQRNRLVQDMSERVESLEGHLPQILSGLRFVLFLPGCT